jgi:hypothetical protein
MGLNLTLVALAVTVIFMFVGALLKIGDIKNLTALLLKWNVADGLRG